MFLIRACGKCERRIFASEHARQKDVIGKLRLARALRAGIDLAERFADYVEGLAVAVLCHAIFSFNEPRINADRRGSQNNDQFNACAKSLRSSLCASSAANSSFAVHTNFHAAIPSPLHACAPPPTLPLRKSLCSRCSGRDFRTTLP